MKYKFTFRKFLKSNVLIISFSVSLKIIYCEECYLNRASNLDLPYSMQASFEFRCASVPISL